MQLQKKDIIATDEMFTIYIDNIPVTKVRANKKLTLPKSDKTNFVAYYDGENYFDENELITVQNDMYLKTAYLGEFKMNYGAAIRLSEKSGLRFYTFVDTDAIQSLKNASIEYSLGTLIGLKNRLGSNDLCFETNQYDSSGKLVYSTVPYNASAFYKDNTGFEGVVGSIVNISDNNITKKFVGRGYIKLTLGSETKNIYASYADDDINNNARSISYVSFRFKNNNYGGLDLSDEHLALVNKWASYMDPYVSDTW
ncbi:MAG: hypothetical protein IJD90_01945 [Clostridia bacterium]|nr:hypothetical protein [Clostridia bacterium]